MSFCFEPVGIVHSCFKDKFGVPRQPGLVPAARGSIELLPAYARAEALRGLEGFSHLWLTFVFHQVKREAWKPTVRPPRLGGNTRLGVFASRSPERPNPLGLSVVKLDAVVTDAQGIRLHISNLDMIDGTPVLDIKPYVSYADCIEQARCGYAPTAPEPALTVEFTDATQQRLLQLAEQYPDFTDLITQVLQQDPRPAYRADAESQRVFGIRLYEFDVKWQVSERRAIVLAIDGA